MENKNLFTQKTSIKRFIFAVENRMFVKAHELLEEDWKEYKKIYKQTNDESYRIKAKAVQGLINGATALALYFDKKRPNSYKKTWEVFKKYEPLIKISNLEILDDYLKAKNILNSINSSIEINDTIFYSEKN